MRRPSSKPDTAAAMAYEALLVPGLFLPSARQAVALADIRRGEAVIDLACGTGVAARLAAPLVGPQGRVVGVDADPGMLDVAAGIVDGDDAAVLELVCADALGLPFRNGAFDVAMCLQGLQFFPDAVLALKELHRVLKPGGRLLVTTWGPLGRMPGHAAIYAALEVRGIPTDSPRRGFGLAEPADVADLLCLGGFKGVQASQMGTRLNFRSARSFVDGILQGAPYTSRALASLPSEVREGCRIAACESLDRFETPSGLVLPGCVNLIRGHR